MAEPKTRPTDASVSDFLAHAPRRDAAEVIDKLMQQATGAQPVLWGTNIVGYSELRNWPVIAFAPRKANLVLYLNPELKDSDFEGLGPHKRGAGCLYLTRFDGIDLEVLQRVIDRSITLSQAEPDVL